MLALGEPDEDFDVALAEARVELIDGPLTELPPGHLEKYGARMAALGMPTEEFLATYSQLLRITPTRTLPWHGRTTPRSVLEVATTAGPHEPRPAPNIRTRPDSGRALRSLFGASPAPSRAAAAAS
jgi:hypothetical protein